MSHFHSLPYIKISVALSYKDSHSCATRHHRGPSPAIVLIIFKYLQEIGLAALRKINSMVVSLLFGNFVLPLPCFFEKHLVASTLAAFNMTAATMLRGPG